MTRLELALGLLVFLATFCLVVAASIMVKKIHTDEATLVITQ